MDQRLTDLARRLAAERSAQNRQRLRYSAELQRQVVEAARGASSRGMSRAGVARALGIFDATLRKWLEASAANGQLSRVRVIDERQQPRGLALVTPAGYRLEGLDPATAAAVLRLLA